MTPSERELGSPSGISEPPHSKLTLRSSGEVTSSDVPDITTPSSQPLAKTLKSLSTPESRLPLTGDPSSISKPRSPSNQRSPNHGRSAVSSRGSSPSGCAIDSNEAYRQLIVRSFAPRVAVFASTDTEEFIGKKGFKNGLYSLLRPYGEYLPGKVVIRNSMGGSRGWDDFGIRFMHSQELQKDSALHAGDETVDPKARSLVIGSKHVFEQTGSSYSNITGASIDNVLDHYLQTGGVFSEGQGKGNVDLQDSYESQQGSSPLYPFYLRKLLSGASIVPYETFSHPVACLIAVSSHNSAPIEALRQLYSNTSPASNRISGWMGTEYLRYYVLVHDEDNDDITKSTALFDLMKRHFGLHCHLLRLRRSQCALTDDDSTKVPSCEWLSVEEEMEKLRMRDYTDDVEFSEQYILESDYTAIQSLLREMVTQSIVPFMESRVMTWNDQIASRRRGISGRFMSLSKRWVGLGSAKNTMPGVAGNSNLSGSNYNYLQGYYPPESPEAAMRQLGDYAFMLRDWKLAYSTYEFLRADFGHDKAWNYHAAANEMAAITALLLPHAFSSKTRTESVDQMLETAAYSYLTRCSMPFSVNRCLTVAMELLINGGPSAVDDTARWGGKLLELGVLSASPQALTTERIAHAYNSRGRTRLTTAGPRKRQTAFWNVLASKSWLRLKRPHQARVRLREASAIYGLDNQDSAGLPFASMLGLWKTLNLALRDSSADDSAALIDTSVAQDFEFNTIEVREQLNAYTNPSIRSGTDAEGFTPQDPGHSHQAGLDNLELQDDGFA